MYQLEKRYHFYAAHRNQNLPGKCSNLHGHTYRVYVGFVFADSLTESATAVTVPFEDIDNIIQPIIKTYDHSLIVDNNDTHLQEAIKAFPSIFGKIVNFDSPTSVEKLCEKLFKEISESSLKPFIDYVDVEETLSSRVRYSPRSFCVE